MKKKINTIKEGKKITKKNIVTFIILFIVFSVGIYLRIGGVLNNSFAFTYDVGRDLLKVQEIVLDGKIPLIGQTTGLGGLFYGPWWYYILTPPFIVSQGNPQGVAAFMVIVGLFVIISGYFLGKKMSGVGLGLIIASFISFSDTMVGYSSQIWNPNIAPLLVILCYLLFITESKKQVINLLVSFSIGFLLGLIFDSEIVFGLFFLTGFALSYLYYKKSSVVSYRTLCIVLGFVFVFLPRVFFELRHDFVMTRSLFVVSDEQQVLDIPNFFTVLPERIGVFIGLLGETFGLNSTGGVVIFVSCVVIWLFMRKSATKNEKVIFITSSITFFVFILLSGVFARAIWGHYLVGIPVIYIIMVSIGMILVIRKNKYFGVLLCILLIILSAKPNQVISNIQNPGWEGNAAVYRNQVAVIDYIYKDVDNKQFNYIAYTPSVHDYPYQYLFSWYGTKAYGYNPSVSTQKLLYVILEPDPGYEGRITDWLKVREGDGVVQEEVVVKGGIRVQKRLR